MQDSWRYEQALSNTRFTEAVVMGGSEVGNAVRCIVVFAEVCGCGWILRGLLAIVREACQLINDGGHANDEGLGLGGVRAVEIIT